MMVLSSPACGYRLLATTLLLDAVRDTMDPDQNSLAWTFLRSNVGTICLGLSYIDESVVISKAVEPENLENYLGKVAHSAHKRIVAVGNGRRRYYKSISEAAKATGDSQYMVRKICVHGGKSKQGWHHVFE